jgi:hypothetical protein
MSSHDRRRLVNSDSFCADTLQSWKPDGWEKTTAYTGSQDRSFERSKEKLHTSSYGLHVNEEI